MPLVEVYKNADHVTDNDVLVSHEFLFGQFLLHRVHIRCVIGNNMKYDFICTLNIQSQERINKPNQNRTQFSVKLSQMHIEHSEYAVFKISKQERLVRN